jgi:hypothetical protein
VPIHEVVSGQEQSERVGALIPRQLVRSRKASLSSRWSTLSRTLMGLVASVRSRTAPKMDSMGLLVRRWIQCSWGRSSKVMKSSQSRFRQ